MHQARQEQSDAVQAAMQTKVARLEQMLHEERAARQEAEKRAVQLVSDLEASVYEKLGDITTATEILHKTTKLHAKQLEQVQQQQQQQVYRALSQAPGDQC